MHPKFKTLSAAEQLSIVKNAFAYLKFDQFYIDLRKSGVKKSEVLKSALGEATSRHLKNIFHAKFGERNF